MKHHGQGREPQALRLSRRSFLIRTGWVAGGVTVLSSCGLVPVLPSFSAPEPDDGLAWLQMLPDGRVRFLCPRAEMGQGAATGLSQIVAEELRVPLSSIDCIYPTTLQIAPTQMTVGSQSIENFFEPVAHAAATLRETLRDRAAARGGVDRSEVALWSDDPERPPGENAFVLPDGRIIPYGELINEGEQTLLVPDPRSAAAPRLSASTDLRVIGTAQTLLHIDAIVTGTETYSCDVRLPGMAFGAVARPPYLHARLQRFDRDAAMAVRGALAVVEGPQGEVGIVAETPMAARRAVEALACQWAPLDPATLAEIQSGNDIDAAIAADALDHTPVDVGSVKRGRANAFAVLNVRYDTPMVAHAAMEPRAGVADVTGDRCTVHTGSQDPWYVQGAVARALGRGRDQVEVHNHRIGGAFGGRLHCQASVEAAWLSKGSGRPVKVQWTREEEFRFNYVGPQFSHRIEAGIDADGNIAFWHHRMIGSPILTSSALLPRHLNWIVDRFPDPGTWRGAELPYRSSNHRIDFADARHPMHTGAWRGLGAAPNTFAVECAMDELAALAGIDPIAFRERHAVDPRLAETLRRVRSLSGWSQRPGLGVAAAAYKGVTFVAVVAQVARRNGRAVVEHLWCAHDCGLVINPDQVRAQIEGNLVWGIGMALSEAFVLENGIAATNNFDRYRIPRNSDAPATDIELIASSQPPSGAGEAAFAPAAAAIVNALATLDGERLRALPVERRG